MCTLKILAKLPQFTRILKLRDEKVEVSHLKLDSKTLLIAEK